MKRVLITLALLALAGAAFAANINDSSVTAENWTPNGQYFTASDLADDNGFTAYTDTEGYLMASVNFRGEASGWLFDPNETINVSVFEDFITDEWLETDRTEECSILFAVGNSDTYGFAQYIAPYDKGPGEYTLEYFGAAGLNPGDEINMVIFMMGELMMDEGGTHILSAPASSTITVRFNKAEEETVVPEPASAAYALLGLGSLLGIKRRIKK